MNMLMHVKTFFKKIINFIIDKLGIIKDIFYIGGSDTLPPPLTQEEEKEIISRLKDSNEAKTILIEHNLRLVVYLAKKFESTGINVEDLISIGTIGLIKAVNTFKAEKNIKLATYASKCIENEILMHLRRVGKTKTEISLDEPLNIDWDGNELLLSDILGTEEDVVFRNMENEVDLSLLNDSIQKLNKREYMIMKLRFGLNNTKSFTQKEVADILGISQSYISRLEKKILNRLKKDINKAV
ncbi:MAG TPA: RNA polymerase sporulation sigma factor SigE [Sedimentibacter sp.]|jgi:RNA polymerase sporulation-specific sigma factor|nr:RNA polymerase sporulation sigma factor SigE [Sedimentibacter sp.]HQC70805.1 RNA polymerase sporulation sigma factor SigE [Sedimentibacter sp.]HQK53653.1 RNA polymerase sporulation sigma factor SigE [Sedimentibacter sp.]HQO95909.1 RNA polymerase sporulation sigma factor SigE [Sedimentibacter sp.]